MTFASFSANTETKLTKLIPFASPKGHRHQEGEKGRGNRDPCLPSPLTHFYHLLVTFFYSEIHRSLRSLLKTSPAAASVLNQKPNYFFPFPFSPPKKQTNGNTASTCSIRTGTLSVSWGEKGKVSDTSFPPRALPLIASGESTWPIRAIIVYK